MQWGYFCSRAPDQRLGVQHLVLQKCPSWAANGIWQSVCLGNWATRYTILNLAQCLLFAGFSWMLHMWVREGLQICVCGTLHSLLSSSLLLRALIRAMGVTCGLCVTKNAGMWMRGCCMGGTCPSTRVVGVCLALQPRWLCLGSEVGTNDPGRLWYMVPDYFRRSPSGLTWQDHRALLLDHGLSHCWWYQPAMRAKKIHGRLQKLVLSNGSEVFWLLW